MKVTSKAPEPIGEIERFLHKYKGELRIDRDGLDDCVIRQPELFYHVAATLAVATAERDAVKLQLEEAEAHESHSIRRAAVQLEEKLTENSLKERLRMSSKLQALEQELLVAKADVEALAAMKEAFSQRSWMIRELVALHLSRAASTSMGGARDNLASPNAPG